MNIREAIEEVRAAAAAYSLRTADGRYVIPRAAQRPLYLFGPPGVGKTAIVAQVCAEQGMGLVSYTMTHHTRQTMLGLPRLETRDVNGEPVAVTDYTMSEIIAEIWRVRGETGCASGILFLDEINCVSETLMPALLELLQNKRFGRYEVPEGWMLVCAGNPPKYNRSARAFDAVTLDRLRVLGIEPDLGAWEAYAARRGLHPAVRGYLKLRPDDFYSEHGVTARAWTDLSDMLVALDTLGIAVTQTLVSEYLRDEEVARRFSLYLNLTRGAAGRFTADTVLNGVPGETQGMSFDEAIFVCELTAGAIADTARGAVRKARRAERLGYFADGIRGAADPKRAGTENLERMEKALKLRPDPDGEERALLDMIRAMLGSETAPDEYARERKAEADAEFETAGAACRRGLDFARGAFPDPHVMTVFLAELKACEPVKRLLKEELTELEADFGTEKRAEALRKKLSREA